MRKILPLPNSIQTLPKHFMQPKTGDDARSVGPYAGGNKQASSYFMSPNRGKKSITVDLKSPVSTVFISGWVMSA